MMFNLHQHMFLSVHRQAGDMGSFVDQTWDRWWAMRKGTGASAGAPAGACSPSQCSALRGSEATGEVAGGSQGIT